jgi:hypothetical protein
VSLPNLTDEQAWTLLSTDPLAYIRELAYAHAEKFGGTMSEPEQEVSPVDLPWPSNGVRDDRAAEMRHGPASGSLIVLDDYRSTKEARCPRSF